MMHLETVFPELYDVLQRGYIHILKQLHDGSITCLDNPEPDYYDYRYEESIYCNSHPAILYLYQSGCGNYRGVIVHYEDIIHH